MIIKRPLSPEKVSAAFQQDLVDAFGSELEAIYLYGSGARGQYDKKRSDINFVVVLSEAGLENLEQVVPVLRRWARHGVAMPLFLTRDYINTSLDSFPIEFLNLQLSYVVLYGPDLLKDLDISRAALRLKCEEQIKGKLLHLREGVLAAWKHKSSLSRFLILTIPTYLSLFRVLLILQDTDVPPVDDQVVKKIAEIYHLDASILQRPLALRNKSIKLDLQALRTLAKSLIAQIKHLSDIIDQLKE